MKKLLHTLLILILSLGSNWAQQMDSSALHLPFQSNLERELWAQGQEEPLKLFKAVDPIPDANSAEWQEIVKVLADKKAKTKNDYKFIRTLFQKTHKKLLKNYKQHSTFNAMLTEGDFDCVSGSAALGLLLKEFGYNFDIIETDYHVFIMVNLDGKNIILESTLPIGGLISKTSEVQAYLDSYKPKENATLSSMNTRIGNSEADISDNSIFRKVNLTQLAGLLYYNDGIFEFNSQQYKSAADQLLKAYELYQSDRIAGLMELSEDLASGKKLIARQD